jgi:hypothetical protein
LKSDRTFYQQSPSSPSNQVPSWEESTPLPEFPPSPTLVVRPSQIAPPIPKREKQVVARQPAVSLPVPRTFSLPFHYPLIFLLAASLILPSFFLGSFLLARFLIEKKEKGIVPTSTLIPPSPPSPSPPLPPEVLILLPWRISSAFIPLAPSAIPADLTKNWDSYINPTLRFSFKYPKEWFLTEFGDSASSILKLSYPVRSSQVGSFAPGEKAYVLVSWEEKRGANLENILSAKYNFFSLEKEEVEISGKKGWRLFNPKGKGEIIVFLEHGQKIISIEGGVKDPKEMIIYQSLFILIQNTFSFS